MAGLLQGRPQRKRQNKPKQRRKERRERNENKEIVSEGTAPDGKAGKTEDVGCVIWCRARGGRCRMKADSLEALGRHVTAELKVSRLVKACRG